VYSKNKKIIDPISHRYWFVEKPEIVKIDKIPLKEFIAKPLLHPQFPNHGTRDVNIPIKDGQSAVFVPNSDLEPVFTEKGKEIHPALKEGDIVRIKDMFNIKILKLGKPILAEFASMEKESEVRKIQAVPLQENISVRVLQPDGIITEGFGEINLKGLAEGTIVQFERYGFVKLINIQEKEIYCYFTST
jgi:glutamyl-tRNA synthetase